MTLDELLKIVAGHGRTAVRLDSRQVSPGDVFAAVPGSACDGHDFIGQAITAGAKYIVCEHAVDGVGPGQAQLIVVDDSARAAGVLAQAASGYPSSKLTNLAVTGTNGKTTVAFLVRRCIQRAGHKCGLIGTVEYDNCSGTIADSTLTTPDCLAIAELTRQMVDNGARYMVTEASSHALSQNRLAGIDFRAAAFTNLTGDHLDYHKTKQEYLAAKTRLFEQLSPDATAVLNTDSPESQQIARKTQASVLWYGIDARRRADLVARIRSMDTTGTAFVLEQWQHKVELKTPLLGRHNVSNCLAAAGLCLAAGLDLETIAAGLSSAQIIPGRLDKVDWPGEFSVLIDYAHTDDALKNVLTTLKPLCKGKLILVFGCGGDRDRTKRPRMARVAEELADFIIVTSDNPRTEDPLAIIEEIVAGFGKPPAVQSDSARNTQYAIRNTILVEPDRRKAVALAIENARKDDVVLIAGKGHENYQIIGTQKFHFSDKEVALQCLENLDRQEKVER